MARDHKRMALNTKSAATGCRIFAELLHRPLRQCVRDAAGAR
ncbi:hypothetical protein BRPE64_CCDS04970 [Caballeronia insecticola]|uniref:Uncharacterized protein n=1 Tax=Caballeronia insecticola TaxID=758793 RepID=R4WYJ3_9BURK|nr:hypothetical protein BRPE64_CCDS04970 [Caballeronia insecticola]